MDDEIFDEDDALDYILVNESTNQDKKNSYNGGCLSSIVFISSFTILMYAFL